MSFLSVAIGGAIGATLRYALGLISIKTDFPLITFIINVLGSFIIGIVVGISEEKEINSNMLLFLRVGFCGGFTTLSTLSVETITLFNDKHYAFGIFYAVISLICSVVGVVIGTFLGKKVLSNI